MIAGKPKMSMITSLLMAVCNLLFDYIFIVNLSMGMRGVACANMIGSLLTIIIGFVFYLNKKQEVHFSSFHKHPKKVILNSFKLGIPGTFTFLALTVNSFITNAILMDVVGENAVAAKSIVNAIQFTFMSAYFGLFSATNPIISYNFGNRNKDKLRKSLVLTYEITTIVTIIIVLLYLIGIEPVKDLFLVNNEIVEINQMVDLGLRVSPFAFFFFGFVVASEECFAALQNSTVSSVISAFENIVFSNLTVILLPKIFGINGFWFSFLTTRITY
jgi:Na+-driven multidrug efflux pump